MGECFPDLLEISSFIEKTEFVGAAQGYTEQQGQVIQSDSKNCKFREVLITPKVSLFHGFRLFYPRNPESYVTFCLSGRPILCELKCCVLTLI